MIMIQVIKGGMKAIIGLNKTQKERVMDDLTLDNPAYIQAKRYGRFFNSKLEKYLFFYNKINDTLLVPRGYNIPFKFDVLRDDRVSQQALYPKFKLNLREDQLKAFEAWNKDRDKGMIVLQTGKGKSILGCYLAYATKQRTLIIVQKNDLVDGWTKDIEQCFGMKKIGRAHV